MFNISCAVINNNGIHNNNCEICKKIIKIYGTCLQYIVCAFYFNYQIINTIQGFVSFKIWIITDNFQKYNTEKLNSKIYRPGSRSKQGNDFTVSR